MKRITFTVDDKDHMMIKKEAVMKGTTVRDLMIDLIRTHYKLKIGHRIERVRKQNG